MVYYFHGTHPDRTIKTKMRINTSVLLKNARNAVAERVYRDRTLVCAYLTGSLLTDDPMLGGATDIDLICVHVDRPALKREIGRITDEVTLDIAHYSQADYGNPRGLRQDPWLGSYLCEKTTVYHDVQHWFEFTQAGVCAQFMRPENILRRAQPLISDARQRWSSLEAEAETFTPQKLWSYLKALENAANAIAVLSGPPIPERRFMLRFVERAAAIKRPGLAAGLEDLFYQPLQVERWQKWLEGSKQAFFAAGESRGSSPRQQACRLPYYLNAAATMFAEKPPAAAWLVLRMWTDAMCSLPSGSAHHAAWLDACRVMSLENDAFRQRLASLDAYLDGVEEALDQWAEENGTTTLTDLA